MSGPGTEDMHVQPLAYFVKQMGKMSDRGITLFRRELALEIVRRKIRALPHNDLRDVYNSCQEAIKDRNI